MAFSGKHITEKPKVPLASLELGDLVLIPGVSGDALIIKDKKEDGTVGVGSPANDRISYKDGKLEVELRLKANKDKSFEMDESVYEEGWGDDNLVSKLQRRIAELEEKLKLCGGI